MPELESKQNPRREHYKGVRTEEDYTTTKRQGPNHISRKHKHGEADSHEGKWDKRRQGRETDLFVG